VDTGERFSGRATGKPAFGLTKNEQKTKKEIELERVNIGRRFSGRATGKASFWVDQKRPENSKKKSNLKE